MKPNRKPTLRLDMVRGKRSVIIGWFWSRDRALQTADNLEWDGTWKVVISREQDT